jgi:hypothetical protein
LSYFGEYGVTGKGEVSREADAMFATVKPEKKLKGMELERLSDEYARHGVARLGFRIRRQRGRDMGWWFSDGEA